MKDYLAISKSKRLGCTVAHFTFLEMMSDMMIDQAGGGEAVFGKKPKVSPYRPTDLGEEQLRAIRANIAASPDLDRMLEQLMPGYGEILRTGSANTLQMLHGEVPKDVQEKVQRNSAFQSLMGGFSGSGMSKALSARDFGLTSLDMMRQGENSAQNWERFALNAKSPYQITPTQQADMTFRNNLGLQNTEQFQFNVDAAPVPSAAGKYNEMNAILSQGMSLAGVVGGALLGGGAGAAAGAAASSRRPAQQEQQGNPQGYTTDAGVYYPPTRVTSNNAPNNYYGDASNSYMNPTSNNFNTTGGGSLANNYYQPWYSQWG